MRCNIIRVSFGAIALGCIAFFIIVMTPTDAKPWDLQYKGPCNRLGAWHGTGDQGFTWIAVDTPGWNATNGQFTVEWIVMDPTLGGYFPDAVRLTKGMGVWKKVGWRTYQYTWIAYGLDENGTLVYTGRASGEAYLVDCDHVEMNYVLEFWPGDTDIYTDPPYFCVPGTAWETRMPLVQAICD